MVDYNKFKEFGRDLYLMINLKHPNLLMCMGAHLDIPYFIVTEHCRGGDLFTLLHRN